MNIFKFLNLRGGYGSGALNVVFQPALFSFQQLGSLSVLFELCLEEASARPYFIILLPHLDNNARQLLLLSRQLILAQVASLVADIDDLADIVFSAS